MADTKQHFHLQKAVRHVVAQTSPYGEQRFTDAMVNLASSLGEDRDPTENHAATAIVEKSLEPLRWRARELRKATRSTKFFPNFPVEKSGELTKAELDVGTLTDFTQITGGQTLGYVSLDTQVARGTIRPSSFTLYQILDKTMANQIVDYWPYVLDTGAPPPGAAFSSYNSVGTGSLNTNAGDYELKNVILKLMVDGRAITTALAAQNSFTNIGEQETMNASLGILSTANWTLYHGDASLYPNQFDGLDTLIPNDTNHRYDFEDYYNSVGTTNSWSREQALYNLIYEGASQLTSYANFGYTTHALMTPNTLAGMQSLVTGVLNNIVNQLTRSMREPIEVNGDLQGMRTRFGEIQFPLDLLITARDIPVAAITNDNGVSKATATSPTPPATVTPAVNTGATGSAFDTTYAGSYVYAVASCDANMNESTLTVSSSATVAAGDSVTLTIAPPGAADASVFRVFRTGLGDTTATSATPGKFRYIGSVAANGSNNVTFTDLNTHIPGSETIYLLDMDEQDGAIDYRMLLPLSRIELFAQNLYSPWAVAMIGALRLRIPKFHGLIHNIVLPEAGFDPTSTN